METIFGIKLREREDEMECPRATMHTVFETNGNLYLPRIYAAL